MTIIEACRDPNLFGPWFKDPGTWAAWQAFLSSLFGLDMDKHQRRLCLHGPQNATTGAAKRSLASVRP